MLEITMPQAGQTMEEGTIVQWLKSPGDVINKGDILAEIETDKAVFEFESPESGTLLKIIEPENAVVPVRKLIALLGAPNEDPDAYMAARAATAAASSQPIETPKAAPAPRATEAPAAGTAEKKPAAPASPAARKAAADLGVDLSSIAAGSGPGGRILSTDVSKASQSPAPRRAASATHRPMSKMRKAIGAGLQLSKSTIPHFYMRLTVDAAPLLAFCQAEKAKYPCGINDVVVLAVSRAIAAFPAFRSRIEDAEIVEFPEASIGIAVALDDGLVVPVVVAADAMNLERLASEIRRVVTSARAGKLEALGRATFTISNLGMFGVEEFSAIINPPETAILAVGAVRETVLVRDGAMRAGQAMTVTLSADHRIIDGAVAAKFLGRLKQLLEHPADIR